MTEGLKLSAALRQKLVLSPQQMHGIELLTKSLPELRAEIVSQIAENPVLEDIDHPLETPLSEVERKHEESVLVSDYPEDDFEPGMNVDEDAEERRQAFFDNLPATSVETLQAHLTAQLATSDIPPEDREFAELLIADLDDDGRHPGNTADVQMACGKTAEEVEATLAKIRRLDPPGCGARNVRECLLAQLDTRPITPVKPLVRKLVESHLEDIAAGRLSAITKDLGVSLDEYAEALRELRTLDPRPGRQYPGERERVEYVNPEIHTRCVDGWWTPVTDKRSLPEIRIAKKYLNLLENPETDAETRRYVLARIEEAKALKECVERRQGTLQEIAEYIYDHQQEFFTGGYAALHPMTEIEVAEAVGVAGTTVSRTVRNKYAETPFGTVELRRFFVSGVQIGSGETVSQDAVMQKLKSIIDAEDKSAPLSDEKLSKRMQDIGYPIARRTVAKYRDRLGIPGASERGV